MGFVNADKGIPLRRACIFAAMSDVVDRIRQVLSEHGVSEDQIRNELAAACGIKYQSVKGWFDGTTKNIQAGNLARIAKRWDVDLYWLVTGEGEMRAGAAHREMTEADYDLIPQYDVRLAGGEGALNEHVEVEGRLAFRRSWLAAIGAKPDNLLVGHLVGQSMYPTIHEGEAVLVDRGQLEPISGKVYAIIRPDGELSAKRLIRRTVGDAWVIRSDNPDKNQYPDEDATIETLHEAPILGRIVWRGGGSGL